MAPVDVADGSPTPIPETEREYMSTVQDINLESRSANLQERHGRPEEMPESYKMLEPHLKFGIFV